jgi:hypothetical protein
MFENAEKTGIITGQMNVYVLSARPSLVDMVKATLKTDQVRTFATTPDLLTALLDSSRASSEMVIIELGSAPDAQRLVGFVKTSGPLHQVLIVALGTEEDLRVLEAAGPIVLDATLRVPCQAADLAAVTAKLREERARRTKTRRGEMDSPIEG